MAENYIGFKLTPEMRAAIIMRAEQDGITASEWIRAAVDRALDDPAPSVDDGYRQARGLAAQMASVMLANARVQMPDTYEEFLQIYGPSNG